MINDDGRDSDALNLIDPRRSAELGDVGAPDYTAATVVSTDGQIQLVLARHDALGVDGARYDSTCAAIEHEGDGPLPLEFVRRLTASRRRQRTEGGDQ